jgi:hypothetical protein
MVTQVSRKPSGFCTKSDFTEGVSSSTGEGVNRDKMNNIKLLSCNGCATPFNGILLVVYSRWGNECKGGKCPMKKTAVILMMVFLLVAFSERPAVAYPVGVGSDIFIIPQEISDW